MIIDGLVFLGTSINGYALSVDDLLGMMDALSITRAVVAPVQPPLYHLPPANDQVAEAVGRHPDRFIGLGRVDPRLGELAVRELDRCVAQLGLRGLFLHPWEEGYPVTSTGCVDVIRHAGRLGTPVVVAAGYPWVSHPLQVAELARSVPDLPVIMTHGGHQNISGLHQIDALTALRMQANLLVTTGGVYRHDFLEEVIAELGAERVLFASQAPVLDLPFEYHRADALRIDPAAKQAVWAGNVLRLFRLS